MFQHNPGPASLAESFSKTKRTGPSGEQLTKATTEDQNVYFSEIKLSLYLLRAFGRFPYTFTKTGPDGFSVCSLPAAYSLLFYLGTCYLGCRSAGEVTTLLRDSPPSLDLQISALLLLASTLHTFLLPLTFWRDAPKLAAYVRRWRDLQVEGGARLEGGGAGRLWGAGTAVLSLLLSLGLSFCHPQLSPLSTLHYLPAIASHLQYHQVLWAATLLQLKAFSQDVTLKMRQAKTGSEMSSLRLAKLEADDLACGLGAALGGTLGATASLAYPCLVLSLYCLLQIALSRAHSALGPVFWGLLVMTLLTTGWLYVHCELAHRTTAQMRDDFRTKLMEMDLKCKSERCLSEVQLVLAGLVLCPPTVQYCGYITIDRRLFTNFLSVTATYLIVLLQFSSSPKDVEAAFNSSKAIIEEKL